MKEYFGVSFTDSGGKNDQTKEQEAAPAADANKKEQQEDKKVLLTHVLVTFKKPRSQSLIPVYVRITVQSCNFLKQVTFGEFGLFSLCVCVPLLLSITMSFPLQDDVPAEQSGSEDSDDSDSDEEDSDDDSDESSEEEDDENEDEEEDGEKEDEPLSLNWPDTRRKQATYLFLLPIVFPLWLTVPDVRNQVHLRRSHI